MVSSPLPAATTGASASATGGLSGAPITPIDTVLIKPGKKDKATGLRGLIDMMSETGRILLAFAALALVWALVGFAALVKAGMCFGSDSTLAQKLLGLLLAFLLGPFYFILDSSKINCKYTSRS
jgi:hypothetical protein